MAKNNFNLKQTSSQTKSNSPLPVSGGTSSAGVRKSTRLNKSQKVRISQSTQAASTLASEVDAQPAPSTKAPKKKSPPSTISWGSPDEGVDEGDDDFDKEQFQAGGAYQRTSNSPETQENKQGKPKKAKKSENSEKSKKSKSDSKVFPEDIAPETPGLIAAIARDVATNPAPEFVDSSSVKKRKRSEDEMSDVPLKKQSRSSESVDIAKDNTPQQQSSDAKVCAEVSKKVIEVRKVPEQEARPRTSHTATAPQARKRKAMDSDEKGEDSPVDTVQRRMKKPRSKPAASEDEIVDRDGPNKPALPKLPPRSSARQVNEVGKPVSDLERSRAMPKKRTSAYMAKDKVVADSSLASLEAEESPALPDDEDVFGDPILQAEDALTRVRAETESSSRRPSLASASVRTQDENRSAPRDIEIFKDKNNSLTKALKSCGYNPEELNKDFVKSQEEQPTPTAKKEKIDRSKREYLPLPKKVGVFDNLMNQPSKSHPDKKPPPPKDYKKDYKGRDKLP